MTPEDVRRLARSVPDRWSELELVHRSSYVDVRARLRHGELDATRIDDGYRIRERGAPASSWTVRPLEPYATNYQWSAMLDPYELTAGVDITEVSRGVLFGRPVVTFEARAIDGYDPVCACCPLVLSETSQRLELGDDWTPEPGSVPPEHVEVALDLDVGIVVSSRDVDGGDGGHGGWFINEILRAG